MLLYLLYLMKKKFPPMGEYNVIDPHPLSLSQGERERIVNSE